MSNEWERPLRGLFGHSAPSEPATNFLAEIAKALEAVPPPQANSGLSALIAPTSTPSRPNALGGLFGLRSPAPVPQPAPPQIRRKIFFSFHFEEDIRRSCVVRQSYRFRPGRKLPTANFYDRSLWESSKREGEESLKRLIREGMAGSSVTCVLAGTYTWQRSWVRYEIARSLVCRNGLFTVFIHNVKDPHYGFGQPGFDPLEFVGLELRPDGRGNICERVGNEWFYFDLHRAPVFWPRWLPKPDVGRVIPISRGTRSYDYHFDDGYNGLAEWAQLAAHDAR